MPTGGFLRFSEVVQTALAVLGGQLSGSTVFVALPGRDAREVVVMDARGQGSHVLQRDVEFPLPEGICAHIAAARESAGGADDGTGAEDGPLAARRPVDIGSYLGIRLELSDGRCVGALSALARAGERFTAPEHQLLHAVARLLAHELERDRRERELEAVNSRLRQQIREMAEVSRFGRQLAASGDFRRVVCDTACGVAGAPVGLLYEPDDEGALVRTAVSGRAETLSLRLDERSVALEAFLKREPVIATRSPRYPGEYARLRSLSGMEAVLAQPVHRDDQPVGVLVLLWKERFGEIHPRVRSVIALLAREAALAMDQRRMLSQLRELAERDELTRLPNRRAWQDGIRRELLRASASRRPLSVALIDLDHFKRFNDDRGHDAGDRCLRDAGAAWRAQLRDGDMLARLGGEEFAVMLPECSAPEGAAVIDRLRAATPLGQTCSAGVAQWDGSETSSELLARADRALYRAKAGGRNRTAVADQPRAAADSAPGRSHPSSGS